MNHPTTPSVPLSAAELDVFKERHVEYEDSGLCFKCVEPWPCDASRLISLARDALAQRDRLASWEYAAKWVNEVFDDDIKFLTFEQRTALDNLRVTLSGQDYMDATERATAGAKEGT